MKNYISTEKNERIKNEKNETMQTGKFLPRLELLMDMNRCLRHMMDLELHRSAGVVHKLAPVARNTALVVAALDTLAHKRMMTDRALHWLWNPHLNEKKTHKNV